MLPLRRYLAALAIAVAAYGAYALLAAPWLEPRAMGRGAASSLPPQAVSVDEGFRELFAPGSWELDNPKIVETAQCTLLFKDYQPLPDGRMEINPCTLIFYTVAGTPKPGSPIAARRPIVLRALQGAVLQFDRPIDLGRATMGRLIEGTLRGSIRIFSPPSQPGANDALELTTRNVKIDREKVYTSSTVDFRYGTSFGRGRDLTITFLPEDKEREKRSPSLGGLSVLQLAHVERLHLEGESSGILPDSAVAGTPGGAAGQQADAAATAELPLEVRCDGPLVIDFEQNLAALDEKVEISRVYPQGPPDRLTCDRLLFHFSQRRGAASKTAASKTPATPTAGSADDNRWSARQLAEQVERVIAIGTPVILDAPQASLYAKAERAEYLAGSKRIALEGGPTAPQVTLRRQESEFEAREIEYELAEPGHLGRLWAAGPGRLNFVPQEGQGGQSVEATWQTELTIAPHEKNKIVALKGRPSVRIGGTSSFSASEIQQADRASGGEIYLWLVEVPTDAPPVAGRDTTSRLVIQPDRMLATGKVEIDSQQLAAHTQELQAWFLHQPAPAQPAAPRPGAIFEPPPQPAPRPPAADSRQLQKLDVTGKLVQLQVLRRGQETLVENLAISGGVTVKELAASGPAAAGPLELVGDLVTLREGTSASAKLEIHGWAGKEGQPPRHAKVSARGMSLSGQTIHLLPVDNRLWISGPGEAVLPVPQDQGQERALVPPPDLRRESVRPAASRDQAAPRPTRPLTVTWHDALEFDGQRGVFSGNVKALGEAEFAAGAELTVTLNQRIDFQAPRQSQAVQLARLHFAGGTADVIMQRVLRDERGQTSAVDNARVRNLDIDQTIGKFTAAGPGEVWTVRRDMKALPGGALAPASQAAGKLAYVCVTFQGKIVGDLNRREVEFQRQVETTYAQVQNWNDRIVATRIEDLGESGVYVQSDSLKLTEMVFSPTQRWIEIDASGNAQAEGLKFVARAARIGYTSDKDQLVIEGDGRVPAEFWSRSAPGGATSYLEARRLLYQRATGSFQVDDAKTGTFDTSNLPKGGKPPPKLR